jgi:hypothetical protein
MVRNSSKRIIYFEIILNIIIPLILGGSLYFMLSENVIFVQKLKNVMGLREASNISFGVHTNTEMSFNILEIMKKYIQKANWLYIFIRNYFLDMLWAYSLNFTIYLLIDIKADKIVRTALIASVFAILMESLQLMQNVSGTFDIWDIISELAAISIASGIIQYQISPKLFKKEAIIEKAQMEE